MKPSLILQPIHNSSTDILRSFLAGKPLTSEQLNFLDWHQKELSNSWYDPIVQYFLKSNKKKLHTSFLLPHEVINQEAIKLLRKRIQATLRNQFSHVSISITQKQFLEFKECTLQELIFWHGNQFLTGAPFFPGGIPPVIYFQWGNLFGVVKYVVLPSEKALKANLLIYFEDILDRDLDRCVEDYNNHLQENIKLQNNLTQNESIFHIPKPTPTHYFLADHV